jgi:PHS family inorganic phosphate transporter-like MFS transporter
MDLNLIISFTDAYQLFNVAFAIIMFNNVYPLSNSQQTAMKVSSSVGAVVGQFMFGWLSDLLGRKKVNYIIPKALD